MAPRDQEPENEKRRDQAFERILAEALSSDARNGDCPDAETLAAFYERALDLAEAARLRSHFAGCSRCQQVLATMAVSDPNPLAAQEVARLGELVAGTSAPRAAAPRPRVLSWPRYLDPRTLAPLAAAAILVIAFWSTTHSPSVPPGGYESEIPAPSSTAEPLVAESNPATAPSGILEERRVPSPTPPPAPPSARPPSPSSPAAPASPAAPSSEAAQSQAAQNETARDESEHDQTEHDQTKMRAPSPAPAGSAGAASESQAESAQAAAPMTPAPEVSSGSANGGASAAADRASGGTGGSISAGGVDGFSSALPSRAAMIRAKASAPAGSIAAKTDPQFIWRFGRAGRIERSSDGGNTWTLQTSPVQSDLLAGSAPSETVCWLVGRNGAIIRTIDGVNWQPVASPPQADENGQPPDWTLVEARDALSAAIRTENGRRFSTTDGGKTWQPQ
jgi:outer membrane biosynthesis protein TonB